MAAVYGSTPRFATPAAPAAPAAPDSAASSPRSAPTSHRVSDDRGRAALAGGSARDRGLVSREADERRMSAATAAHFIVDDSIWPQRRNGLPQQREFTVVTVQRRIAALASRQSGVVSRAQLLGLGVPPRTINHWSSRGRILVIHRGVYAVGHASLSPRGRSVAALLAVGRDAVLSHRWAAAMWGLVDWPPHPHVTAPGRRLRSRPDIMIHSTPSGDVRRRDGLPITSPLRTLADIGADERAVAEAQVLGLVTRRELASAGGRLARAVTDASAAPTRSVLERALLRIVAEAQLPRPLVNHRVGRFEVDFLWPEQRLIVETDGWGAHGHRHAFERDRARDAELLALGHVVLRFTWRQLRDEPLLVAARLAQVLAARPVAASLAEPPPPAPLAAPPSAVPG
jgi:very-short-patch-repair endonuclease